MKSLRNLHHLGNHSTRISKPITRKKTQFPNVREFTMVHMISNYSVIYFSEMGH